MKIICVNRSAFEKCLGYGIWGLTSIFFVVVMFSANYEISTITEFTDNDSFSYNDKICYTNVFDGYKEKCTTKIDWITRITSNERFTGSSIINIINVLGVVLWIYTKQQKVKFSFCEKNNNSTSLNATKGM